MFFTAIIILYSQAETQGSRFDRVNDPLEMPAFHREKVFLRIFETVCMYSTGLYVDVHSEA